MARRRSVSTDISIDRAVARLASTAGEFAALLYTWMIPHAEDDCSLTADPEEIAMMVIPGLRHRTAEDVGQALAVMAELGLIHFRGGRIWFPSESFYKHQSYIPQHRRNYWDKDADPEANSEVRHSAATSPQNTASLSPSLSLTADVDADSAPAREEPDPGQAEAERLLATDLLNWHGLKTVRDSLYDFAAELGWPVVVIAMRRTIEGSPSRSWRYCRRILNAWSERKVRSPTDVAALDAQFEAQKQAATKPPRSKQPRAGPKSLQRTQSYDDLIIRG